MESPLIVFIVEHVHILEDGEENVKLIGVYSTQDRAQEAVERMKLKPGFRDAPEGFTVDPYELDQDNWDEGYVTVRPGWRTTNGG